MVKGDHIAIRMCIGCRRRRRKEEMLRFIKNGDNILFANKRKGIRGRSFYLCQDLVCLEMAKKRFRWLESLESTNLFSPSMKVLE